MNAQDLVGQIGDPIAIRALATAFTTDVETSTDTIWLSSVPVLGYDGVLFIEICSATDSTDLHQIQIIYSSSSTDKTALSESSNAASSAAGWTCSDALMTAGPRVDVGDINMLDFRFGQKEMSGGYLFAQLIPGIEAGAAAGALIAIPYGGTGRDPVTKSITPVIADHKSP
jgi:hypothetical protein